MRFVIKNEIRGRMRIHLMQNRMSYEDADILQYYLESIKGVKMAKVYDRTSDAVICYESDREEIIRQIRTFKYEKVEVPTGLLENSGRELNAEFQEKLISKIVYHYADADDSTVKYSVRYEKFLDGESCDY